MSHLFNILAVAFAIIATGLVAGVFLAFSDFTMRSLKIIPPVAGAEIMQVLNREVYRSIFIKLLVGMSIYSAVLGIYAAFALQGSVAAWAIIGSLVYFVGTFLVTIIFNVPMNQKLDVMDHKAASTAEYWAHYAKVWTYWNHVRTIAPVLSMFSYLISFYFLVQQPAVVAV